MKKNNKNNLIIKILIVILLLVFCFSLYKVIMWFVDNSRTSKVINDISEIVDVQEKDDSDKTVVIEQKKKIDENSPYWKYIKMKLINVDFNELKKRNSDTVGWIQVNGTNINYPFVKTNDNDYYLDHSFDKKKNDSGWVFLDYRNNIDKLDRNTILYAHSRVNGTMFGTLKNILKSSWVNNTDNYVIKLSTDKENTLWQVFSVYKIPVTSDYLQIHFSSNKEFQNFGDMLLKRSEYNFNTYIDKEDKILTLSTCYDDDARVVLHAKLIKKEAR